MSAHTLLGHPMVTTKEQLIRPGLLDILSRGNLADPYFQNNLHTEIVGTSEGVQRATQLNAEGYGIISEFIHFSDYDGIVAVGQALHVPEFRKHPAVFPIAYHQYYDHLVQLSALKFISRGHLMPIVTEDTMAIEKYQQMGLKLGDGVFPYLCLGAQALREGGIVGFAPQGGRRNTLDIAQITPALSALLKLAIKNDYFKIAILTMGIDYKEIVHPADYRQFREMKLGQYTPVVRYGRCTTLEELGFKPGLTSDALRERLNLTNIWGFYELGSVAPWDYPSPGFDMSKQPDLS